MSKQTIALFSALAIGLISLSASAQEFSIKGTWTGHRERVSQTEGYRNGTATLVVTEEQGRWIHIRSATVGPGMPRLGLGSPGIFVG
jgi:hypothetical protein